MSFSHSEGRTFLNSKPRNLAPKVWGTSKYGITVEPRFVSLFPPKSSETLVPKSRAISTPHFDGREAKQDLFRSESHSNSTALKNAKILLPAPPQHGRSLSTDGRLQNSKAKPPPPVPSKPNNIQQKLNELQLAKTPGWSPPGTTRTESTNAVRPVGEEILIVTASDDERHNVDHPPPEHLRRGEETPPPTEDEPQNALIQVTQQVSTFSNDFVNNAGGIINPLATKARGGLVDMGVGAKKLIDKIKIPAVFMATQNDLVDVTSKMNGAEGLCKNASHYRWTYIYPTHPSKR